MENTNRKNVENKNQSGKDEVKVENNKVIQLNETQEVIQEMKEIGAAKASNSFDLEIAKAIVNGTVDKTKLRTATELEKAKLEHEANIKFKEVEERLELRRMELRAKEKIVKEITDAGVIIGIVAGITTASVLNTRSHNAVKIQKMEHGILD